MKSESVVTKDSYIDLLTAMLNCRVAGMNAENEQRAIQGESMAYTDEHYVMLHEEYRKIFEGYQRQMSKRR